ncbi:hypothetical protein SLE2022_143940 [Rubroshorea leprosula]
MELPVSTSFSTVSRFLFSPKVPSKHSFFGPKIQGIVSGKLSFNSRSMLRIPMCTEKESSSSSYGVENKEREVQSEGLQGDYEFVEVIAIGSRRDAVLEFCFDSPFQLASLRFWSVLMNDALNMQLEQKLCRKDLSRRVVDAAFFQHSCSKAIILVAGAGCGLDFIGAIDILKTIRSAKGFAVAIVLKPFSFEGQRRLDEVKDLVGKLQEYTDFFIDIDTDTLLKKELVTLDEALKIANNAALLALNTISVLLSETYRRKIDVVHKNAKEINVSEVVNILGRYGEAKIGFGAAYDISASISQAIYDCPFIGAGIKDLDGMVICVLASSKAISSNDVQAFLHVFRQTTEYMREIIISVVHEPKLEPNLLVTTVVIIGCLQQEASPKSNIFSRLAQHFPFVSNLLKIKYKQPNDAYGNDVLKNASPTYSTEMENKIAVEGPSKTLDNYTEEMQTSQSSNYDNIYILRNHDNGSDESEVELLDGRTDSPSYYDEIAEGNPTFQRGALSNWNLGPGHMIAKEWAKERAADSADTPVCDNLSIFGLPVGVRPSREMEDSVSTSLATEHKQPKSEADVGAQSPGRTDVPKKQGVVSARAASMLEAERDAPKKWNPVVEIQYRGGIYKGHCQGGLPEGKGQLVLGDGSMYDGMWRYGKRSGLGTFYFSNGDVFQGSWRDDLIHGKGWFYYHTGDRWFANFWKGKANGEGRFYSKSGDVFFGHFEDGWRHGRFLCINVDGARCIEIWNEGFLVSREQLDADSVSR